MVLFLFLIPYIYGYPSLSKHGKGEEDFVSDSYGFIYIDRFKDNDLLNQLHDFHSRLGVLNPIYEF